MWVISNLIYRVMSVLWLFWWLGRSLWLGYQTRQDFSCCFWWFTLLTSDSPQSFVYTEINTASSHLREKTSYSKNECFSVSKENIIFRGWTSKIPKSSQSTKCAVIISCLSDVRAGLSITRALAFRISSRYQKAGKDSLVVADGKDRRGVGVMIWQRGRPSRNMPCRHTLFMSWNCLGVGREGWWQIVCLKWIRLPF